MKSKPPMAPPGAETQETHGYRQLERHVYRHVYTRVYRQVYRHVYRHAYIHAQRMSIDVCGALGGPIGRLSLDGNRRPQDSGQQ